MTTRVYVWSEERRAKQSAVQRARRLREGRVEPGSPEDLSRRATAVNRVRERKRVIVESAKDVPCVRCGDRHPPYVMDFHHRDRSEKHANISKVYTWSDERLLAEIAKCDVLCANCHRQVEYELRSGQVGDANATPVMVLS